VVPQLTCPECSASLAATREILYSQVVLNHELQPVKGTELGEAWRIYCERGHELQVVETNGSRVLAVSKDNKP